ncbi:peptidoglycan D,D-transpeptidase FtsI family protein [Miniphocaeibacter massiliensis]|uniref:peptidoglycan D,D-transpeptidase FtsI family protein n=1 Tax=Miniphocaeibacter massiliensis TaxID=2041841 RepID=UPI001F5E18DB|nr:penicillin-binding protein 2 [Miniphocaeibacter massiliensis]
MEKYNKKILIVFTAFVFLFVGLILYMTYFQIVKSKELKNNKQYSQYDSRNTVDENKVKRGTIYDRDGNILVSTKRQSDGNNYREFVYGKTYAPVTGYNSKSYGTSGLESTYRDELLAIKKDTPLSDLKKLIKDDKEGNDLILTTNTELQELATDLLSDEGKGSIVAMNPKTGEIYAMASNPIFDPTTITADWNEIIADKDNESKLLNRATQGKYTPGSVFKIITATGILENQDKIENMTIQDEGETTIGGYTFGNVNRKANGRTDLEKAIIKSSNVYFGTLGVEIGANSLKEVAEKFYIGKDFTFDLGTVKSTNGIDKGMEESNLARTSFGQGDDLVVTPLHMAMATSAIANNGVMMKPYLVKEIRTPEKEVKSKTEAKVLSNVTTPEIAQEILGDMVSMVNSSGNAYIRGVDVAGKSGTAEIGKDKDSTNAWFIATAPAENPTIAVAVVLEDSGDSGGEVAAPIARKIIKRSLELGLGK